MQGTSISVLVITADQPAQVKLVLASLAEQDMDADSFEVHVCDDGLADIGMIVDEFRSRLHVTYRILEPRQANWRVPASRNMGLRFCKSQRVLLLDGDCILAPSALRKHCAYGCEPLVVGGRRHHVPADKWPSLVGGEARVFEAALNLCTREQTRHWSKDLRRMTRIALKRGFYELTSVDPEWLSGFQISYPSEPVRAIGGFWEAFDDYGGEELELNRRLARLGLGFRIRLDALCLHLDHPDHPAKASKWWDRMLTLSEQMPSLVRNGGPLVPVDERADHA